MEETLKNYAIVSLNYERWLPFFSCTFILMAVTAGVEIFARCWPLGLYQAYVRNN